MHAEHSHLPLQSHEQSDKNNKLFSSRHTVPMRQFTETVYSYMAMHILKETNKPAGSDKYYKFYENSAYI